MVPRSRLLGDRQRRHEQGRDRQDDANQARHDVEHGELLGVVAGVQSTNRNGRAGRLADTERPAAGRGRARRSAMAESRRGGVADRGGVGGVGVRSGSTARRRGRPSGRKLGGMLDDEQQRRPGRVPRSGSVSGTGKRADRRNSRCSAAPRASVRSYFEWSAVSSPVGKCLGSALMAKPNRNSCMIRHQMMKRSGERIASSPGSIPCASVRQHAPERKFRHGWPAGFWLDAEQVDEDVLERRRDLVPASGRRSAVAAGTASARSSAVAVGAGRRGAPCRTRPRASTRGHGARSSRVTASGRARRQSTSNVHVRPVPLARHLAPARL